MKKISVFCIASALSVSAFAAGPGGFGGGSSGGFGGDSSMGGMGDMGGMGGSSGSFVYDTFITEAETSGNAIIRDGVWCGVTDGATSVTLPASVVSAVEGVAASSVDLVTADLSAATSLSTLPAYAFLGCTSLESVTLASSATADSTAFDLCALLGTDGASSSGGGSSSSSGGSSSSSSGDSASGDASSGDGEDSSSDGSSAVDTSSDDASSDDTSSDDPDYGAWTETAKTKLYGAVYDADGDVVGVTQVNMSKVNVKKSTLRITGNVVLRTGKKHLFKSVTVTVPDDSCIETDVTVRNLGTLRLKVGDGGFGGTIDSLYTIEEKSVGGAWTSNGEVDVDFSDTTGLPESDWDLSALLPDGEAVYPTGAGKWSFDSAASVKWTKIKGTEETVLVVDEESGKGLVIDTKGGLKPNIPAMRLYYTPKTGIFRGTFKVFAVLNGRLKRYTVRVNGVVVEGEGTGVAVLSKTGGSWPVTVTVQ